MPWRRGAEGRVPSPTNAPPFALRFARRRRLLEALPLRSNKGAFWYSQGAFRLLLVRRVMDLVYASVGTAIDMTGPDGAYGLWVPLAGMFAR